MEKGSLEAKKEHEEWSNLYEFKRWMKPQKQTLHEQLKEATILSK